MEFREMHEAAARLRRQRPRRRGHAESPPSSAPRLELPLTVLTVNKDEEQGHRILNEASSLSAALRHDRAVRAAATGNAPERIANFIREHDHDLLFIGAYGHSRIIEMVLGSTTEYVLRNTDCPVFLNR